MKTTLSYCVYDLNSGEIKRICRGSAEAVAYLRSEGYGVLENVEADGSHIVDISGPEHVLAPKTPVPYTLSPATIPADGITPALITGLPDGCRLLLDNEWIDIDGNQVAITLDLPGSCHIMLRSPLHLDTALEITAL